jgi:aldehyde:ferredoxin oxidoreductase
VTALEWGGGKPVNLRKEHDQLPDHFFTPAEGRLLPPYPPAEHPHPPLNREHFELAKTEYYTYMGWDVETGLPKRSSLEALGMGDVVTAFEAKGFRLPA